ncbi:MAG TPA: RICIN domain-containing protein [Pseudonocardia sp.]
MRSGCGPRREWCDPGAPAQHWKLTPSGEHLAVTSRAGERCLDVQGASAADFATILTYACNRQPNQQWTRGAPE